MTIHTPGVRTPGFLSEPKVESLPAVLEKLRQATLEVPRFQRPFVWDASKQLELLRSVRDGLPIGSLMIWQTLSTAVTASDQLGDRRLPRSNAPIHSYLLDGQQRMATLYGALVPLAADESPPPQTAYLDLEKDDFVLLASDQREVRYLPLSVVLDSPKLRRAFRAFPEEVAEAWIERSETVATAFKDYKLATITILTDDLDIAIRTFERVNTQGAQMSGVHMIHALSWSEDFHLLDQMDEQRRELLAEIGWDEIDDERILDVCRIRLGLPLDKTLGDRLARKLRTEPSVLRDAVTDIARAARFLQDHCGVSTPRLLPYRQQLLVLSAALRVLPEPSPDVAGRWIAWFWVSTLTGWFEGEGSAARGRLRASLDDIVDIGLGARKHPFDHRRERRPLSPALNLNSGRGRAFVLLLASLHPLRANGEVADLASLIDRDHIELPWMFSRYQLGDEAASPGNRFLLAAHHVDELKRHMRKPWGAIEAIARSHAVTEDARNMIARGHYSEFVTARRARLDTLEEGLLQSNFDALD